MGGTGAGDHWSGSTWPVSARVPAGSHPEGAAGEHMIQEAESKADLCDSDEFQSISVQIFRFIFLASARVVRINWQFGLQ